MLLYVIPQYMKNIGDGCIVKEDGVEKMYEIKINQVLKNICRERMLDFKEVKRKSRKTVGQSNIIPLLFSKDEIMFPIKIRKPKVSRDEVYGYINFNFIDKIEEGHIVLKDGQKIYYIESQRAVLKRTNLVRILKREIKSSDLCVNFDLKLPATKEDVYLLLREIYDIKKLLE
ncbi:hypothetical protein ABG79_00521 [Caloramator mitchellensis]|uniref:ComK protein n=1 Tax=Caloramator mitchellensis TaxID=908809 RepID=A0A0R3JVZ3_CALMK|nr:hypothetical protein [Caloramator mitchellensis]KRQ87719.1 hypothetical protein ABG79_00521 [Caloramator mitchellensis]